MKKQNGFEMYIISVVVPIFHGKQYIKSLIEQIETGRMKLSDDDKIELIFVNDDPAETISVNDKPESIDIKIIPTDRNRGIHGARVRGLENSTGKYVLFLDQDDRIYPDYFFSQLQSIKDNDGVVCQVIHEKKLFYNKMMPFHKMMNKKFIFENGCPIISPGQVLLRRKSIPDLWKENIVENNGADDFFLWLCMLAEGKKFALNEQVLFEHVVKYGNASLDSYKMMCSEEEVVHILVKSNIFSDEDNLLLEKMLQRMKKKSLGNLDKFRKMFYVLDDWTTIEEEGKGIVRYLKDHKIRNLAVYGFGPLGRKLIKKLEGSDVCVQYIIDQNAAFLETEYMSCTLEDDLAEVDAVVIALVQGETMIKEAIKRKLPVKVFTIGELVNTIYESS